MILQIGELRNVSAGTQHLQMKEYESSLLMVNLIHESETMRVVFIDSVPGLTLNSTPPGTTIFLRDRNLWAPQTTALLSADDVEVFRDVCPSLIASWELQQRMVENQIQKHNFGYQGMLTKSQFCYHRAQMYLDSELQRWTAVRQRFSHISQLKPTREWRRILSLRALDRAQLKM
jgi:hypothetical protein